MSVDAHDFRKTLGCFATGIVVVTALRISGDAVGRGVGVTINAFTSVSLDPPLVAFCLGRASTLFEDLTIAPRFVVNVLSADQRDLSQRFSSRATQGDWGGVSLRAGDDAIPVLAGTAATIECVRETVLDGGDHAIILGRVERLTRDETVKPLLYHHGRYAEVA